MVAKDKAVPPTALFREMFTCHGIKLSQIVLLQVASFPGL
jgi:hypothetical protein